MSSHTCPRCGAVTDSVLPSGLCVTCHGRQDDTRQSPSVVADAPTPSFDPAAAGTLTFAAPADTTLTRDGETGADPFGVLPAGGYMYGEVLGTGGMGCVYRAVRVSTGQVVAVKKLRPERYTPSLLRRFVQEARILARVEHPNVVRLHDFVPDPGDPHIVMDFVDGCSLADRLADGKGLPAEQAAQLIADAARGVAAAHAAGGIHRDLKPGNLLVTKANQIKVSDFGLGKVIVDDGDAPTLTASDSPIGGTPGYAAPEQVAEGGVCDERTDVWGLGACLHACLVGKPPYPTGRANLTRVLSDPLVPPRAVNRTVPAVLDAIACKCLEKDPAKRYQSAAALADDLDRYLRREPTVAKPLPWAARAWRRVRAVPREAVITALVAVALTAGTVFAFLPRKPVDPLAAQQAALRDGREVVLIDNGKFLLEPKWLLGNPVLTPPTEAEPFVTFASAEKVMLAVMTDPGVDRYRITARLRQLPATAEVESALNNGMGTVGVFLGHREVRFEDGLKATAYMALGYNDRQPDPAKPRKTHLAYFDVGQVESPLFQPILDDRMGPNARLDFVPALPGPWRTLTLDVSPDEVTLHLPTGPRALSRSELDGRCQVLEDRLRVACGNRPLGTQQWSPRSPVGVFVDRTRVAVERFTLTPLSPVPE